MRHFKRENCNSKVRKQFETITKERISLIGTHAHEWSVVRESKNISMLTFNSRVAAVQHYNQLYKDLKQK